MNFDGATRGNLGPSGVGYIIRNWEGEWVSRLSKFIPLGTKNEVEFRALILGLKDFARSWNYQMWF